MTREPIMDTQRFIQRVTRRAQSALVQRSHEQRLRYRRQQLLSAAGCVPEVHTEHHESSVCAESLHDNSRPQPLPSWLMRRYRDDDEGFNALVARPGAFPLLLLRLKG